MVSYFVTEERSHSIVESDSIVSIFPPTALTLKVTVVQNLTNRLHDPLIPWSLQRQSSHHGGLQIIQIVSKILKKYFRLIISYQQALHAHPNTSKHDVGTQPDFFLEFISISLFRVQIRIRFHTFQIGISFKPNKSYAWFTNDHNPYI